MSPADKRVLDLLDRWLTSVELHIKYLDLSDADYRQVQPWPEHERPARWILELAQQKVLQLKTLSKTHIASKDDSFAESLELMCFLANLVGAQNIKRSIPLADPARQQSLAIPAEAEVTQEPPPPTVQSNSANDNATRELPKIKPTATRTQIDGDHTREMPRLKIPTKKASPAVARGNIETQAKRAPTKTAATSPMTTQAAQSTTRAQEIVVADAVRLLKWGREWHELTELIARMAERPSATEVRRILRVHKSAIEAQLRSK